VRRNIITLGTLLSAALLAAGCSSSAPGEPGPLTTSAGAVASSTANLYGAPHVSNPLDTSAFQKNPCSSLTTAQLNALNVGTQSEVRNNPAGPTCAWKPGAGESRSVALITYVTSGQGLSGVYSDKNAGGPFEILPPVDGYPAVYAPVTDERSRGVCQIGVGVSDTLVVVIGLTINSGQYKTDPCTPNTQLAADVISNIKSGG
jgi:hypothetical protein